MQGNRGNRDPFFDFGDPFGGFGAFGDHRNLMSSFFGGRDPFDDPFFTRPFGGVFESSFFGRPVSPFINTPPPPFINNQPFINTPPPGFLEDGAPQDNRRKGPIIEELNSDDEKEEAGKEERRENPRKHGRSTSKPYVEEPDVEAEVRRTKQMPYRTALSIGNNTQSLPQGHSFTFQSSSVTYGGANGAYYTSSRTRRTGSDGFNFEESKEADSASRQATHQITRGIHEKGHSVARKLNSDGRVDTMQTLHNINEVELAGFDQAWKKNARNHLPGWSDGHNANEAIGSGGNLLPGAASREGWALPSSERLYHSGDTKPYVGDGAGPSKLQNRGRTAGDFGAGTASFQGRSRAAGPSNVDQVRKP